MLQLPVEAALDEPSAKHLFHPLQVTEVVRETDDASSLVFAIPAALGGVFRYRAGQFLTLEVPFEGGNLRRCYSLASSPQCDAAPKVTVKRVTGGRVSNWINDHVRAGDTLSVMPPEGRFVLTDTDAPLLLFAGGSGITPVVSLVKTALVTGARSVVLLYANRDERSIIFRDEIAELVKKYPGRVDLRLHLDDNAGFVTEDAVRPFAERGGARGVFYICGPGPFMETVERGLLGAGIAGDRIRIERFASLLDAAPAANPAPAPTAGDGLPETIEIELRGEKRDVAYQKGASLLQTARAGGFDAPYSCEEGFCGCCAARLLEGRVHMASTDALSEEEQRRGLILTCQARPLTSRCRIRYEE